jgi:transcriptional regulator with XRE-family HTH domain
MARKAAAMKRPGAEGEHGHQIGRRLREARELRGFTLRALASQIGLTASLLSQIETGQVNPSVDTLFALAQGLGVEVAYFFPTSDPKPAAEAAQAPRTSPLVRRAHRHRIQLDHGVVWESLLPAEEPPMEWMAIHYPPGAVSSATMQRHGGRDYGVVVTGRLTVKLAFSEYILEPGDSIAFDASSPHQLRNDGDTPVEAVWLVHGRHAVT